MRRDSTWAVARSKSIYVAKIGLSNFEFSMTLSAQILRTDAQIVRLCATFLSRQVPLHNTTAICKPSSQVMCQA